MEFDTFGEVYDFHPLKIKLDSGIETQLDGFHLSFTYGGVMDFGSFEDINQDIIKGIQMKRVFGDRKMYYIPLDPKDYMAMLPLFSCFAWLSSFEPTQDPNDHGSALVIQWFEKSMDNRPLQQIIQEAVKKVDWNKEAEGFMF